MPTFSDSSHHGVGPSCDYPSLDARRSDMISDTRTDPGNLTSEHDAVVTFGAAHDLVRIRNCNGGILGWKQSGGDVA